MSKIKDFNSKLDLIFNLMDFEEDEQALNLLEQEWDMLTADRAEKIANFCWVYKNLVDKGKSIVDRAQERLKRGRSLLHQAETLKGFLQSQLKEREEFETPDHRLMWRKSDKLIIDSLEKVPAAYLIEQPPKVDKVKLKKEFKNWIDEAAPSEFRSSDFAHIETSVNMSIK